MKTSPLRPHQAVRDESSRFIAPDFQKPFDLDAELAAIPKTATVRGMFIGMINDHARSVLGHPLSDDDPHAFGSIPARDYLTLVAKAAQTFHPAVPPREGIRRLGQRVFSDFNENMVGKAIFAVAGKSFDRLAQLAPKAYEVSYAPCSVRSMIRAPGHVHVVFEPMYILPECFHIGAWEDAARFCGGTVRVLHSVATEPGHMEYDITFSKA